MSIFYHQRHKKMYQGTNPTALKSQQQILETMRNLLKNKTYVEISISEICEQSHTSRQTFYKLFGTKENLLLFLLQNAPYADQRQESDTLITLTEFCQQFAKYIVANQTLLQMLIDNNLMDVLYQQMYQGISSCRQMLTALDDELREYVVEFLCAGLCRLTYRYLTQQSEPNETQLTELAQQLISGKFYL